MTESHRPDETSVRLFSEQRTSTCSCSLWPHKSSFRCVFAFLLLLVLLTITVYQYGDLNSARSVYHSILSRRTVWSVLVPSDTFNASDWLSLPSRISRCSRNVTVHDNLNANVNRNFRQNNSSSRLTDKSGDDGRILSRLASAKCCSAYASANVIGESHDYRSTYYYPVADLSFPIGLRVPCDSRTELFIAIKSTSNNLERRDSLRRSYLAPEACRSNANVQFCNEAWLRTRYAFFVASPDSNSDLQVLREEAAKFGDIVQISLAESYRNLTLKTAGSLYWSVSRCSGAKYIVSTDDDMLLSVTNIWRVILGLEDSQDLQQLQWTKTAAFPEGIRAFKRDLLSGKLASDEPVHRGGKYGILTTAYPASYYPDFLKGWFVLLSSDVARELVGASFCVRLLWLDDVFLFGILAEALQLKRTALPGLTGYWERPRDFPDQFCDSLLATMLASETEAPGFWQTCRSR